MNKLRSAATLIGVAAVVAYGAPVAAMPSTCTESEPCWMWSTMGNLKRGVTLKSGKRLVVSASQFRALEARIDWTKTRRLRGDAVARGR